MPLMDMFALGARPARILNTLITSAMMCGLHAQIMVALAATCYHHSRLSCTI